MAVSERAKVRLGQAAALVLFLTAVEWMVRQRWVSVLVLSPPSAVALKMWEDLKGRELWLGLQVTAMEFLAAAVISLAVGSLCGVVFSRFRILGSAVEPLLLAFYSAPTILLYPVFLTLFGLGSPAIVSMAVVLGSIPIMVNVSVGLAGVDPIFIKLGRSLGAGPWLMFRKVMLPAATPTIFTGLRLGFTYALVGVIAVEFITFSGGLGKLVSWRYFLFDTEGLFSAIVFVVLIASLMNRLLQRMEDRIRKRWT